MTITVFGATGQVGKRVVQQALAKGFMVRAFGRNIVEQMIDNAANKQLQTIQGYVFDEETVFNAVNGADAVISTLGGAFDGTDKTRSLGIKNIIAQLQKLKQKRIVVLGGLGVLDDDSGRLLMDAPNYPAQFLPVGKEHLQAYLYLKESDLDWTFVCAPNILDEDGHQAYITNIKYPPVPNSYEIAAGDLAHYMLNVLTERKFFQKKIGICKA